MNKKDEFKQWLEKKQTHDRVSQNVGSQLVRRNIDSSDFIFKGRLPTPEEFIEGLGFPSKKR